MRYDDFRRSDDIEDRRDDSGGGMGGGFGIPMGGGGGLGIGTIIVLGLLGYAFGIDPRILIGGAEILTGGGSQAPSYQTDRPSGQRPERCRVGPTGGRRDQPEGDGDAGEREGKRSGDGEGHGPESSCRRPAGT